MKNYWTLFRACLVAAVLSMTACSEDQSELHLSDLGGKATIEGVVTYNSGASQSSGVTISENYVAASGVTVMVTLAYSEISSGAQGNVVYSGVTDSNGKYSIDADIVAVGSVSVKVNVAPFTKDFKVLSNGSIVTVEDAYFEATSVTKSVSTDMPAYIVDLAATTTDGIDSSVMTTPLLFGIKTYMKVETFDDEAAFLWSAFSTSTEAYSGAEIEVTLKNSQDSRTLTYTINTNSDGEATLSATVYDSWDLNDVTASYELVPKYIEDSFAHYYVKDGGSITDVNVQRLDGYYENSTTYSASISNLEDNASYGNVRYWSSLTVVFTPSADEDIKGVDNTTDYEAYNPCGWIR